MAWSRRRKRILIGIGAFAVLLVAFLFGRRIWWVLSGAHTRNLITISEETTRITGPLDPLGFVDYLEAVNQDASEGVTPENNFEVVVRQAVGTADLDPAVAAEYFRRLGIEVPSGDTRISGSFDAILNSAEQPGVEKPSVTEVPWKAADYPDVAAWLEQNRRQLDTVVEGTRLPKDYMPLVSSIGRLQSATLAFQSRRVLARALSARAMLHIGEGRPDEAWSDILAMFRMSRHTARGPMMLQYLVGSAIDAMACRCAVFLLQETSPVAQQLNRHRSDIASVGELPAAWETIDRTERYNTLQLISDFPRGMAAAARAGGVRGIFVGSAAANSDWDGILRASNERFDRVVAAFKIQEIRERSSTLQAIESEYAARAAQQSGAAAGIRNLITGNTYKSITEVLFGMGLPSVTALAKAEAGARVRFEVVVVAFALEQYRADHGAYPGTLDALVPKYLVDPPIDGFSGEPLVYKPSERGYTLYSIGVNGKDDDGVIAGPSRTQDDIAVKIGR